MPYRFKAKESVAENVRRIAQEEIDSAVDLLSHSAAGRKRDEAVHEARKNIKKTRALLRLIAPEIGNKTFRRENSALRDTGHQLSVLRDAAALLETVDHIAHERAALKPAVLTAVRKGLAQDKRSIEQEFARARTLPPALSSLRAIGRRIKQWPLQNDGFSAIAPGLKASYRAGRKALKVADRKHDVVAYHDLRKRVKDHWYHVRLLESVWTEIMQAHEASLKELETWLGEDHNVSVLRDKLEHDPERFGGEENVRAFLALASEYQKELQEKALSAARRVYAEKPRVFVDNLAALWHAWQQQPPAMKQVEHEQRAKAKKSAA